jgi:16S rRNA (guanine527-N7)-methyltransferase
MDTNRIAELVTPFLGGTPLVPKQLDQLARYLDLLLRWNAKTNLTAVRDEESIVTRHIGESLFAARHLFPPDAERACTAIDLGSGAGFPGVPLKIHAPEISLTLIESQNKKATFLKEVVRSLRLQDIRVFNGRAEDFPGRANLVTLRAVEHFKEVLPVAASLLGGTPPLTSDSETGVPHPSPQERVRRCGPALRLGLLIGESQVERAQRLLPGFSWQKPAPIPHSSARVLLIGLKQALASQSE